ncbi:hypothetical protein Nocox_00060 [Nonomuraea coxensis DSM 45129]|uniref:Core-binding (CB) domain-containing protein n=1 Tax=Nonomuraea coxensis DSM 45129 TaxID=1122611 RepID=A0ABX8TSF2_9ACTN|nr:site-specific integrase [Nonomuraea coxensis]QYC37651.1 hypothetical protein Nocox_00060 [Nonomuraea coxensis DSM 45129]
MDVLKGGCGLALANERKLRDLSAQDVDKWLAAKAKTHSTSTVARLRSCLNRIIKRAMARDKVRRNVVELCRVPQGQEGRPSKALRMAQAEEVLKAAEGKNLCAPIVVSLLTGARTEELRALRWDHVDLMGNLDGIRRYRRTSPCGAPYGTGETPRPASAAVPSRFLSGAWTC